MNFFILWSSYLILDHKAKRKAKIAVVSLGHRMYPNRFLLTLEYISLVLIELSIRIFDYSFIRVQEVYTTNLQI